MIGFLDAGGTLFATRIDFGEQDAPLRIRGTIDAVDQAAMKLQIGALTVTYGNTAMLIGFEDGVPRADDFVRVQGELSGGGALDASSIERQRRAPFAVDGIEGSVEVSLEGFVTRFASSDDFDVDGQPVSASAATGFVNGTQTELMLNARLQAVGALGSDGVVAAERLRFLRAGVLRIAAPFDVVDVDESTITVLGTLVRIRPDTFIEDQSALGERLFSLADLSAGDLRSYEEPAGSHEIVASRLEREDEDDDDDDVELTGFVEELDDPEFFVLGIRVVTTVDTEFDDIGRDDFFSDAVGQLFEIEGRIVNGELIADEIELEDGG